MDSIRAGFQEYFSSFGVELPENIEPQGDFRSKGWSISYKLMKDNQGLLCMNVTADHRMTNTRYFRILHNGEVINFEGFTDHYSYSEGNQAEAQAKMREHNDKVAEILRQEGFIG